MIRYVLNGRGNVSLIPGLSYCRDVPTIPPVGAINRASTIWLIARNRALDGWDHRRHALDKGVLFHRRLLYLKRSRPRGAMAEPTNSMYADRGARFGLTIYCEPRRILPQL